MRDNPPPPASIQHRPFQTAELGLTGAAQLTPTNSGYTVFIDLTSLSGFTPQFTTGVDGITVFIVGETNPFFAEVESLAFTAVPEPSAALLAGLGLAAVWIYRRRGAKNAPR